MGAVHPWAASIMESVAIALAALWMARVLFGRTPLTLQERDIRPLAFVVLALSALVAFQVLPLPPAVLEVIAPASYQAYRAGLPGWPEHEAYGWLADAQSLQPQSAYVVLPTPTEVAGGARVPFVPPAHANGLSQQLVQTLSVAPRAWMPISVAPRLTVPALLKLLAYSSIFLLLIFYPFTPQQESRLNKGLVRIVLITALIVSLVGLSQPIFSNGKPLWIFTPYEFIGSHTWGNRIFGPFANPDHYADYLAMLWPFALCGILFPSILGRVRDWAAVPMLSATVGLLIVAASIATASRGGWLAAAAGTVTVAGFANLLPSATRPALFSVAKHRGPLVTTGALILSGLCLVLLFTSNASRSEADTRLAAAFSHDSLWQRTAPARDSSAIISTSPLFGIGLGAWPEIYPKYASPPWDGVYMDATHDDYVQFVTEVGLIGLLIALAVLAIIVKRVKPAILTLSPDRVPAAIACAGALTAVAAHSFLDFSLRVPANALLATVCLATLMRLCSSPTPKSGALPNWTQRAIALAMLAIVPLALWAVLVQPLTPYPFDLHRPDSIDAAVREILKYPTNARPHLELAKMLDDRNAAKWKLAEISAALKLEPTSPVAHDLYAHSLALSGRRSEALREVEESVFFAPTQANHFYLGRLLPWFTRDEHSAMESGLKRAVAAGYWPASQTLASFYEALGRHQDQALLLCELASSEIDSSRKAALFNRAGLAYAAAGKPEQAVATLRQALEADPSDPIAYRSLAIEVYAKRGDFAQARQVLDEGLANGAPAVPLYIALADMEQDRKDLPAAAKALEQAASAEPSNFYVIRRVGDTYYAQQKYDRAAIWYQKAIALNPQSAATYFVLGLAEEKGYQFFAAERDFAQALRLDENNSDYRAYYAAFKNKVADARRP
ncbi:MAG: tetratricopeptide repeat protein [Candidatus Binataceae bacterium]